MCEMIKWGMESKFWLVFFLVLIGWDMLVEVVGGGNFVDMVYGVDVGFVIGGFDDFGVVCVVGFVGVG